MTISVPATSANLGPGFDTLGLALSLYNEIDIKRANFSSISIIGEGAENIKLKKNNLFLSIFNEIYYELTGKKDSFRMVFKNHIPFSRGLGSSSAVITSAIASAYAMAEFKIDKNVVLNRSLVYENHPDNISPAVLGGFVTSVVHNNQVNSIKKAIGDDIKAVVVIPDKPMSTKESRTKLPKHYSMSECVSNLSHSAFLTACFLEEKYDLLKIASKDMMHEELRMQTLPELFDVRKTAYENGALMSTLSGSGSTFLNITYKSDAANLQERLKDKFKNFRVEILSFDNNGFIISKS
ncbi:homoserine kinase [Campylobacter sp. RM16187]|uniref:homoserine kinase n=1 Tax=Campylobacter sp. RM16187 TaxID=1660063 RepID=UPI0021B5F605|nr:homoserine kinase [Campylobacter sp. RM16187]QKG28656.1 homoserine kinase [Campylobacter sp. RM16187]